MLGVWLRKNLVAVILVFLCLIGALLVYRVHYYFDDYRYSGEPCSNCTKEPILYPFPLHGDEWTHLAQGIYIIEERTLPKVNPYVGWKHHDLEPGFNVLIAQFFILTGLDPLFNYQFLPMIFMIIYTLIIYVFVSRVSNNKYIGLLSIPFFFALKNNINILGVWFFVPLTLGIFFIFSYLYLFISKQYVLSMIIFLTSIFTYPLAGVIILITTICYMVVEHAMHIKQRKWHYIKQMKWHYLIIICIIIAFVFLAANVPWLHEKIIFREGWTKGFEKIYTIFEIYGIIGTIFAIIGAFIALHKRYNKVLLILPAIFLLNVVFFMIFKFTYLIPYQRSVFYLILSLVPLSAIALFHFLYIVWQSTKSRKLAIVLISTIIIAVLVFPFHDYYTIKDVRFKIYHFVTQNDYDALKWIEQNYGIKDRIIVPWDASFGVYPISRIKVLAMPESNLQVGNINEIVAFYRSNDCRFKQNFSYDLSDTVKLHVIYSRQKIECPKFMEVYSSNGYVYYRSN